MDELRASSQQSAEQAEMSASEARQVLTLSEGGTKAVEQSVQEMSRKIKSGPSPPKFSA